MPGVFGLDREPDFTMDPTELSKQPKDINVEELKKGGEKFKELQNKRVSLHDIKEGDKVDFPDPDEIISKVKKIRAKDEERQKKPPVNDAESEK